MFRQGYFVAMYFLAVVLHELAHYYVAKRLFYRCVKINVGIFGAVLYGDFSGAEGIDGVKIALAGPVCNVAMCVACLALWWSFPATYALTECFFSANASMACVNMLPCYPLDGGRVAVAVLGKKFGNALALVKRATIVFSLALFGLFVVSLFTFYKLFNVGLFAVCLFCGAFAESGGERYARLSVGDSFFKRSKRGMEQKTLVFSNDATLADVVKRMKGGFLYRLEVVDGNLDVTNQLSVSQLEHAVLNYPSTTLLSELR